MGLWSAIFQFEYYRVKAVGCFFHYKLTNDVPVILSARDKLRVIGEYSQIKK